MPIFKLKKEVQDFKRLEEIVVVLFKHEFGFLLDKLKLKPLLPMHHRFKAEKFRERKTQPQELRAVLEELGGTFVKLGQLLSMRPDLIPQEYCEEFKKLQDDVKPFSGKEAKQIIESELQQPISKVFSYFKDRPIAAASVGQVHEAVLRSGKKVAVKVQRPGIRKKFEIDIDILYKLAEILKKHMQLDIADPVEIVKEFERYTRNEFDYVLEAKNIERVYNNFVRDKKLKKFVKIPKVYWEFTSERVLTMEYIYGIRLSDVIATKTSKLFNRQLVLERITNSIFKMVFIDGFFHADPHPGNIFILSKNRIAFLDFGIVGSFGEELRLKATELFIGVVTDDVDAIIKSLIELEVVSPEVDRENLKIDIRNQLRRYYGTALKELKLSDLFHRVVSLARKNKMKLPVDLVLLGKAVVTVESLAYELDPNFNFVKEAQPFAKRLLKEKASPEHIFAKIVRTSNSLKEFVAKVPNQTTELLGMLRDSDKYIHAIDSDVKELTVELDKLGVRIGLGILIAAFTLASAMMISYDQVLVFGLPFFSAIGFGTAMLLLVLLVVSVIRDRKR